MFENIRPGMFNRYFINAFSWFFSGIKRNAEWFVAGVDGLLEFTQFFGGSTITGNVPFNVNEGEGNLI